MSLRNEKALHRALADYSWDGLVVGLRRQSGDTGVYTMTAEAVHRWVPVRWYEDSAPKDPYICGTTSQTIELRRCKVEPEDAIEHRTAQRALDDGDPVIVLSWGTGCGRRLRTSTSCTRWRAGGVVQGAQGADEHRGCGGAVGDGLELHAQRHGRAADRLRPCRAAPVRGVRGSRRRMVMGRNRWRPPNSRTRRGTGYRGIKSAPTPLTVLQGRPRATTVLPGGYPPRA